MPDSNEQRPLEGFEELAADVLSGEELELDLLLRHDRDPGSLSPGERSRVEAYLAASPAHRDRARLMVRLAAAESPLAALGLGPEDLAAESSDGAEVITLSRFRRQAVPLALAATVLFGLLGAAIYNRFLAPEDEGPRVAEDAGAPVGREPVLPIPDPAAEPESELLAEGVVAPDPAPAPPPIEPAPPTPADPPRSTPRPQDLAERSEPPHPAPDSRPGASPTPDPADALEEREPILLAAILDAGPLDYVPPAGLEGLVRIEGRLRGEAGEGAEPLSVTTLSPAPGGLTVEASPSLYWFVSRATGARQQLVLIDKRARATVLEIELPVSGPAIQGLDLADHGVELEPGADYRWIVAVVHDPNRRSRDTAASGEIRRVDPAPALVAALEAAAPAERAHYLARAGIWYDALAWLSEQVAASPDEPRLRSLRADLLAAEGLSDAARFDRRVAASQSAPGDG